MQTSSLLKTARSFWVLQARKVLGSEGNSHVLVAHVFLHEDSLSAMAKVKLPLFTPSPLFFHLPPPLLANSPSDLFLVLYWPCFLPLLLYNPKSATCSSVNSSFKPIPAPGFPQTMLAFLIYSEKCCQNPLLPNTLLATSFQRVTASGLGREEGGREHHPQDLMAAGRGMLTLLPESGGIGTFQGSWIRHRRHFSPLLGKGTQLVAETRSGSPVL